MTASPLLTTPRLSLRPWTAEDLDAFFDVYSRDEVARWLGRRPRRPLADHDEAARRLAAWTSVTSQLPDPEGLWAIVPSSQVWPDQAERPVGTVLLLPLSDEDGTETGDIEIGWHLHPDWQGRGLATEAAMALLDAASVAGIPDVLALTDPDNEASQAVARRLGMRDEGETDRWFGLSMRQFRTG
ncbi:MAG: GNAT family N-acetyltransferase [Actinomycetes bacterium]